MKYQKKIGIILISTLFIIILGLTAQGNEQADVEFLIQAFEKTNAEVESYWLHIGLPYTEYVDEADLLKQGNRLSKKLMLPKKEALESIGEISAFVNKGTWGNQTEVQFAIKRQNEQNKELYLLFHLKGTGTLDTFKEYYKTLENILIENQIPPKINSCIQGNINDKLDNGQQFVLLNQVLENLDAEEIESLDTDLVKSVSAYSPKMKYSIMTANKKMNIQVATHINSLNQKTILTMGTPIITIEY